MSSKKADIFYSFLRCSSPRVLTWCCLCSFFPVLQPKLVCVCLSLIFPVSPSVLSGVPASHRTPCCWREAVQRQALRPLSPGKEESCTWPRHSVLMRPPRSGVGCGFSCAVEELSTSQGLLEVRHPRIQTSDPCLGKDNNFPEQRESACPCNFSSAVFICVFAKLRCPVEKEAQSRFTSGRPGVEIFSRAPQEWCSWWW